MPATKEEFEAHYISHKKWADANHEFYKLYSQYREGDESLKPRLDELSKEIETLYADMMQKFEKVNHWKH